jgi:Ser/Thr protein kinase RdoA (MazF antagonist)
MSANPEEIEMNADQFEALPRERQLHLLTELGMNALSLWGLDGADLQLLKHRENTVMKVTTPSGDCYAMRIHRLAYHSDTNLLSELQWLDSLRAAGIATTEAIRALDDSLFVTVSTATLPEGRQCDLLTWVPGAAIGSIEEGVALDEATLVDVYQSAGELAARIHNHGETWPRPAGFTRLSWDEAGFFGESGSVCGRYWDLADLTPGQLALLHRARDVTAAALDDFGKSADRYGLVHGDMLPENLFYDGSELRLIDWDDTGFGWHLYDFATAMFAHLDRPGFDTALAAMVEGYRRHRVLPDKHLKMLPILIMARALSYVGWAHTRRETAGEMTPLIIDTACELAQQLLNEQSQL